MARHPGAGLGNLAGFKPLPVQQPNQPPQLRTPAQTQPGAQGGLTALGGMSLNKPTIPGNPFVQQNQALQQNLPPAQKLNVNQAEADKVATEEKIKLQKLKNEELILKRQQAEFNLQRKKELFFQKQQDSGLTDLASINLNGV